MTSSVLLTHAFDACISQLHCYDVDDCNHFAGSGIFTGLWSSAGLSWPHRYCKVTPSDVCVFQFNLTMRIAMITLRVVRS